MKQGGAQRPLGVISHIARGRLEHREHAVTQQLHDPAALLQDRFAGAHEVGIQHLRDFGRRQHFRQGQEIADIGEQHGPVAAFLRSARVVEGHPRRAGGEPGRRCHPRGRAQRLRCGRIRPGTGETAWLPEEWC